MKIKLIVSCLLALVLFPASAWGISELYLESDRGDYIGLGKSYHYTTADTVFSTETSSFHFPVGPRNQVSVSILGKDFSTWDGPNDHWWSLDLHSNSGPLTTGTYHNAKRFPFNSANNPGLDFGGEGRGCNTLKGEFTVHQIRFDRENNVRRLEASFIQHCEGKRPALKGHLFYRTKAFCFQARHGCFVKPGGLQSDFSFTERDTLCGDRKLARYCTDYKSSLIQYNHPNKGGQHLFFVSNQEKQYVGFNSLCGKSLRQSSAVSQTVSNWSDVVSLAPKNIPAAKRLTCNEMKNSLGIR